MPDKGSPWLGLLMWVIIWYPLWSPRMRRIRREKRAAGARSSTVIEDSGVSGNGRLLTGSDWEQDRPWILDCLEEE